jgi:hypothetical protein
MVPKRHSCTGVGFVALDGLAGVLDGVEACERLVELVVGRVFQ